jgi:hypothetical protein
VFAQCEECFRSTLLQYHAYDRSSVPGPSPHALLKKSVSGLTASSFSLITSEMFESLARSSVTASGSGTSSGVLVSLPDSSPVQPPKRSWDWRAGLPEDAKAEDIIRILRLALAKGLSVGAIGGAVV